MGIQEGQNPKVLEELLKNYLPSSKRDIELGDNVAAEVEE
jgi:chemotaxis protein MotA